MSADPFQNRAAQAEQEAAIESMRARAIMAEKDRPMVTLPFGRQQPLDKYTGIRVLPFVRNQFVSDPSVLLENPDPTAHYGFAKRDDPQTRGNIRSGKYEDVYWDELKQNTDAAIYVSEAIPQEPEVDAQGIVTERGPRRLVLWHGLQLVKIPKQWWNREVEEPAMQSVARLAMHQESFRSGTMRPTSAVTEDDGQGGTVTTHQSGGRDYRDVTRSVRTEFSVEA